MINPEKYRKSLYLRASDLVALRTKVRIDGVGEEEVGSHGEVKIVLRFTTPTLKPLPCGYEKLQALVAGLGGDETKWPGAIIVLVKTKRLFQGKMVDSIVIEVPPQPPTVPAAAPPPAEPAPPPAESMLVLPDEADLV
jgi:hypothetical protein